MSAPLPPADLDRRSLELVNLSAGTILERFHTASHDPIFFDRSRDGRLNAPDGSYGVLYAADGLRGAFAETFLQTPGRTLLPLDLVYVKARARLRVVRELRLVRLSGTGLARAGATAEVTHGSLPYDIPQAWSKALRAHPIKPDGIFYTSRHDDEAGCFALFGHLPSCVAVEERIPDLDADWFWALAALYGVGMAPF